ncbi:Uncharacterised protein [Weissella viridescens]|uniref:DUF1214 domain-containing protein n=1 Tax=Weissella viridescens TaxID=1629 RepID=A0A380NZ99_WEIVI|nr:Uncharacterised protein [Weissella viridescens]
MIDKYSTLGIFDGNISDDAKQALLAAPKTGQQQIKHLLENVPFPVENGWQKDFHVFDYNFDYFELGSLDTDEWKLPHSNEKELVQANFIRAAALGGLWGNQGFEAVYLPIYVDSDNKQLNGSHDYEVHFEQTPPTNAFWSVTMYNTTGFTLVETQLIDIQLVIALRALSTTKMVDLQSASLTRNPKMTQIGYHHQMPISVPYFAYTCQLKMLLMALTISLPSRKFKHLLNTLIMSVFFIRHKYAHLFDII